MNQHLQEQTQRASKAQADADLEWARYYSTEAQLKQIQNTLSQAMSGQNAANEQIRAEYLNVIEGLKNESSRL